MTTLGKPFDIVCFDCDSTLSRVEGIDELARRAGAETEVAPLTAAAMAGELALDAVYGKRLDLVRPDRAAVEWLAKLYVEKMVPGAVESVQTLRGAGTDVHIISGGLRQAILPLADTLGVPVANVHAVDVMFGGNGAYVDFDRDSPLARPGGKAEVCRLLGSNERSVALVGDGATDLEAREAGAYVVGFGGVVVRDTVKLRADIFVAGPSLTAVLDALL
ncbi:HAD-IB family phosphatase [Methyloceanibacter caenitepidi]|uniref:phosphoserine phosphatase n=1 Tax=Methyloceanibacter caenitepidi TaxID=1384459 RepID=A0A0A8K464_9HYPH|nr:HAD-IB family phosphatase [Methyloceanibacter caenitepidi]BAQ16779.1 phosphoserine phosphatase [Methyloceanibacter caenitepidi]